jgi:hypothetical protein
MTKPQKTTAAPAPPQTRSSATGVAQLLIYAALLGLAAYGIFEWPYKFPQAEPVWSESYAMGFNNRVSLLATLAALSGLCLAHLLFSKTALAPGTLVRTFAEAPAAGAARMSKVPLVTFITIYAVLTLILYWLIPLDTYGEGRYFLRRAELVGRYGLHAYRDFEFTYGPALVYVPALFYWIVGHLGGSLELSYALSYIALCAAGLWALFYFVDHLNVEVPYRVFLFSLMALVFYNVTMGAQYTALRYVMPYALILVLHEYLGSRKGPRDRRFWIQSALIVIGLPLAVFSVSPEVGLVYFLAQTLYVGYLAWTSDRRFLLLAGAGLLSLPACILFFTYEYFASILFFTAGASIFPVVPAGFVVLYLLSVFCLIPVLANTVVRGERDGHKPLVLALAAMSVGLIPGALGRCDPGHVIWYGCGALLLTMTLLIRFRPKLFQVYAILFVLFCLVGKTASEVYLYRNELMPVHYALVTGHVIPDPGLPPAVDKLGLAEFDSVMTPLEVDWNLERYLRERGKLAHEYYLWGCNVYTAESVERKIQDIRKAKRLLVPAWVLNFANPQAVEAALDSPQQRAQAEQSTNDLLGMLLLYPVNYEMKNRPYEPRWKIAAYIAAHFKPVRTGEGYAVMEPK